ncbi:MULTISPECIES: YybH family protein [unclassified Micromonospora]|uniref:YybH family protein n=1 Tax=unclassified Micromonospora TaxID=2617518 RepID=UPI003A8876BF
MRTLIGRWTAAVQRRDLAAVLADHADDIVMFDVPPPQQGVRGIDAYRESWPPFFQWLASGGGVFEIESLEVTAGDDVAFAYALLRCGTQASLAEQPDVRLRLTLGLRRQNGRWIVAHEHHSFPLADTTPQRSAQDAAPDQGAAQAEQDLRQLHQDWFDATTARDLDRLTAPIADDVVSYEHEQPLRYVGIDAVREVCRAGLDAAGDGTVTWTVPDLTVMVDGDLAVTWGLNRVRLEPAEATPFDSWSRGTRVFRRRDGAWRMVHQHLSYPYDPSTGAARTDLHGV